MENNAVIPPDLAEQRAKRIFFLRKKVLNQSRSTFAKRHKIPVGSIQNWEDIRFGGLTEQGAFRLIKAFRDEGIECNLDWLLYGRGNEPVIHTLVGTVPIDGASGLSFTREDTPDDVALIEELKVFYKFHQNAVDAKIIEDALAPCYLVGQHVAGEKLFNIDINKAIGMACIIQTQDGQQFIRQLEEGTNKGCYNLIATNPTTTAPEPIIANVKLFSAAPIIWIRKPQVN